MSTLLHPALMKLIRLQSRGGIRQFRKSLRTVRGVFQLVFFVGLMLYGAGSMYFFGRLTANSQEMAGTVGIIQNDVLSVMLFVATTGIVLFSSGEAAVYFTASEVAFLFTAPLTRRELLLYKLFKSLLGIIALSLFVSLFTVPKIGMSLPRLVGTVLTISFLQLLTMNVAFARQILEEKLHLALRRGLGLVLGVLVLMAINQMQKTAPTGNWTVYAKQFHESQIGRIILAPFDVFVGMLAANNLAMFAPCAAIVLLIDLLLLFIAIRLDALSLEAAFVISEKITNKLKVMQSKGVWHAMGPASSSVAKRKIPQLPFWGGVGPIIWQRLTTIYRSSTKIMSILGLALIFITGLIYFVNNAKDGDKIAPFLGMGAMSYMSLLICLMLQNEIERVGYLKSLPVGTIAIVVGELLGIVVVLSTIQALYILVLCGVFPERAPWLLTGAVLTFPLNFLLFSIDKLVFYIYPTRMAKGAPGDFQNSGKQMIFIALKMTMLFGCLLLTGLSTLPGALLLQSPVAAVGCAAMILVIECVLMVPLLIVAFERFDPSTTIVT